MRELCEFIPLSENVRKIWIPARTLFEINFMGGDTYTRFLIRIRNIVC